MQKILDAIIIALKGLGIIGAIVAMVVFVLFWVVLAPILVIWGLNTLFGLGIVWSLNTWAAALILLMILRNSTEVKVNQS